MIILAYLGAGLASGVPALLIVEGLFTSTSLLVGGDGVGGSCMAGCSSKRGVSPSANMIGRSRISEAVSWGGGAAGFVAEVRRT